MSSDTHLSPEQQLTRLLQKSREQRGKPSALLTPRGGSSGGAGAAGAVAGIGAGQGGISTPTTSNVGTPGSNVSSVKSIGRAFTPERGAPKWIRKVKTQRLQAVQDAERILGRLKESRDRNSTPQGAKQERKRPPSPLRRRPSATGRSEDRRNLRHDPSPVAQPRHQPVPVSKRRAASPDSAAIESLVSSPATAVSDANGATATTPGSVSRTQRIRAHVHFAHAHASPTNRNLTSAATRDTPPHVMDVMPTNTGSMTSTSSGSGPSASSATRSGSVSPAALGDISALQHLMPTAETTVHKASPQRPGRTTPNSIPPTSPTVPTSSETTAEIKRALKTSHTLSPQFPSPSSRLRSAQLAPAQRGDDSMHNTSHDDEPKPTPSKFQAAAANSKTDPEVLKVMAVVDDDDITNVTPAGSPITAAGALSMEGSRTRNISLSESIIAAGMSVEDTSEDVSTHSSADELDDDESGGDVLHRAEQLRREQEHRKLELERMEMYRQQAAHAAAQEAQRLERKRQAQEEVQRQRKIREEEEHSRQVAILRRAELEAERARARAQAEAQRKELERQKEQQRLAGERIREQERLLAQAQAEAEEAERKAVEEFARRSAMEESAAIKIQAETRRYLAVKRYNAVWTAAVILQTHWARRKTRKIRTRLGLLHLQRNQAATRIQSRVRAWLQRARFQRFQAYVRVRNASVRIQMWYRRRARAKREREAQERRLRPSAVKQPVFRVNDHIVTGIRDSRRHVPVSGTPPRAPAPGTTTPPATPTPPTSDSTIAPLSPMTPPASPQVAKVEATRPQSTPETASQPGPRSPVPQATPAAAPASTFKRQVDENMQAATKIQAIHRGRLARRSYNRMRVHDWLASIGVAKYTTLFHKHYLSYECLPHLEVQVLQEVGMTGVHTQITLAKSALMSASDGMTSAREQALARQARHPQDSIQTSTSLSGWLSDIHVTPWKNAIISSVQTLDRLLDMSYEDIMQLALPAGVRLTLCTRLGLHPSDPVVISPAKNKSPLSQRRPSPVSAQPSLGLRQEIQTPGSTDAVDGDDSTLGESGTSQIAGAARSVPMRRVSVGGGPVAGPDTLTAPTRDVAMWICFEEFDPPGKTRRRSSSAVRRDSMGSTVAAITGGPPGATPYTTQGTPEVLTDQSPIDGQPRFRLCASSVYYVHIFIAQDPTHGFWFESIDSVTFRNVRKGFGGSNKGQSRPVEDSHARAVTIPTPFMRSTTAKGVIHIIAPWDPAEHSSDFFKTRTGADNALLVNIAFDCQMKGKHTHLILDKDICLRISAAGAKFRKRRFLSSASRFKVPERLPDWVKTMAGEAISQYGTHGLLLMFKKRQPHRRRSAQPAGSGAGTGSGSTPNSKPVVSSGLTAPPTLRAPSEPGTPDSGTAGKHTPQKPAPFDEPVPGNGATTSSPSASKHRATKPASVEAGDIDVADVDAAAVTPIKSGKKKKKDKGKSRDVTPGTTPSKKDKKKRKKTLTPIPAPPLPPRE